MESLTACLEFSAPSRLKVNQCVVPLPSLASGGCVKWACSRAIRAEMRYMWEEEGWGVGAGGGIKDVSVIWKTKSDVGLAAKNAAHTCDSAQSGFLTNLSASLNPFGFNPDQSVVFADQDTLFCVFTRRTRCYRRLCFFVERILRYKWHFFLCFPVIFPWLKYLLCSLQIQFKTISAIFGVSEWPLYIYKILLLLYCELLPWMVTQLTNCSCNKKGNIIVRCLLPHCNSWT